MLIGQRLRELRESKNLSQGDIEKRTGLIRVYTSRVENGHTVPSIETLEKYARALEVPMYRLFYDGREPPKKPELASENVGQWGTRDKQERELIMFTQSLASMKPRDRALLLGLAERMARRKMGKQKSS